MKKLLLVFFSCICIPFLYGQNVGIGTRTPEASALLEVASSSKGFLPPRVALTSLKDFVTVLNPATGLIVYNTATAGTPPFEVLPGLYYFTGTSWYRLNNPGVLPGEMQYWNGTQWIAVTTGQPGQFLQLNASQQPIWAGNVFPKVSTKLVTVISNTTITAGGNVLADGGVVVTARGVVCSHNPNPTISNSIKTVDGADTGNFVSNISTLDSNTVYYIRAYATSNVGTDYGNQVRFFTATGESQNVQTLLLCNQEWMAKNLNSSTYRNGNPIPQVTDPSAWQNLTTGAWCYYSNDNTLGEKYGKLYNWYALNDARGLAPQGWHLPSDTEWAGLVSCLGGDTVAGGKMKAISALWDSPNTAASDQSSFNGLPGGFRKPDGNFDSTGKKGHWWSSTASGVSSSWHRNLSYLSAIAARQTSEKRNGYAVRCIKSQPLLVLGIADTIIINRGTSVGISTNIAATFSFNKPGAGVVNSNGVFTASNADGVYRLTIKSEADTNIAVFKTVIISKFADIFNDMRLNGGYLLSFRHANASNGSDQPQSTVPEWWKSCSNLLARQLTPNIGPQQSDTTGKALKVLRFNFDSIMSSVYCRCKQTAQFLDLSLPIKEHEEISQYYDEPNRYAKTMNLYATKPLIPQKNYIAITHAGFSVRPSFAPMSLLLQGDCVVFKLNGIGIAPTFIAIVVTADWINLGRP